MSLLVPPPVLDVDGARRGAAGRDEGHLGRLPVRGDRRPPQLQEGGQQGAAHHLL